ncbi:HupE/UreJ family protein [Arthrobacter sp. 35W]|uniref:HupE/UreJ family protein n=1 Tax=Arthrobacter sp. 35W TaxID=1132441 RepID=UPI0004178AB0|nr:HupE/UreJ family protein [Arthrobacter sp. 35W]
MRRLLMFLVALVVAFGPAAAAQAHPVGTTGVLIDFEGGHLGLTLQLQLDQLNKATGLGLVPGGLLPTADIERLVAEKVSLTSDGAAYATETTGIRYDSINGTDALVVDLAAAPGAGHGPFTLAYSLLTDTLSGHKVYVSRVVDGSEAELLGVITATQPTLAIDPRSQKASVGSMIEHGMAHIADGYDHLLFLAVLLLSAPLVAKRTSAGWRWSPRADSLGSSVKRILTIVTAFTAGHSITLLVVSLGWFTPPVRYIETIVAVSIAVAAWNLVRPMFAHGEVVLAGVFGLVHGMAFATTILEMKLDTADTLLAVLGFNIGIELAQLIGVVLTVPLIHVAATGNHYRRFCMVFAVFGIVASAAWTVGIWTGSDSVLTPLFDAVAGQPLLSYAVFAAAMLTLGFIRPKTTGKVALERPTGGTKARSSVAPPARR